jgi:hypothetical protein
MSANRAGNRRERGVIGDPHAIIAQLSHSAFPRGIRITTRIPHAQ